MKSSETCCHPHCRKPADSTVHEDPKTGRVSPEFASRGYCNLHDTIRLQKAQEAWESAHRAEILAAQGMTTHQTSEQAPAQVPKQPGQQSLQTF